MYLITRHLHLHLLISSPLLPQTPSAAGWIAGWRCSNNPNARHGSLGRMICARLRCEPRRNTSIRYRYDIDDLGICDDSAVCLSVQPLSSTPRTCCTPTHAATHGRASSHTVTTHTQEAIATTGDASKAVGGASPRGESAQRCQVHIEAFEPSAAAARSIPPPPLASVMDGMALSLHACHGGAWSVWRWRRVARWRQARQLQLQLSKVLSDGAARPCQAMGAAASESWCLRVGARLAPRVPFNPLAQAARCSRRVLGAELFAHSEATGTLHTRQSVAVLLPQLAVYRRLIEAEFTRGGGRMRTREMERR